MVGFGFRGSIQGRGLGTHLLRLIERKRLEIGGNTLLVNAPPGARSFFRKNGFTEGESCFLQKPMSAAPLNENAIRNLKRLSRIEQNTVL